MATAAPYGPPMAQINALSILVLPYTQVKYSMDPSTHLKFHMNFAIAIAITIAIPFAKFIK